MKSIIVVSVLLQSVLVCISFRLNSQAPKNSFINRYSLGNNVEIVTACSTASKKGWMRIMR